MLGFDIFRKGLLISETLSFYIRNIYSSEDIAHKSEEYTFL